MNPTRSTRAALAGSLREMAGLLALAGKSPFRARAHERAATALEHLDSDLVALVEAGRLTELPGIGRGIAAMIAELQRTGRSNLLDSLRERMPPGALPLGRIPGLGLDKIRALHAALGVETAADLKKACEKGRVRTVKGMGQRTERRLLERIQAAEPPGEVRLRLDRALALAESDQQRSQPPRPLARWIRAARERGLRFVVSTDAHSVDALANQRYGVAMARRGWVRRGEVLNTLDTEAFVHAVSPAGLA